MTAAEKLQICKERDAAVIERQRMLWKLQDALKDIESLKNILGNWYDKLEGTDALWAEEIEKNKKYEAALKQIVVGKIPSDNTHPLGEWFSMSGRFLTIAQEALK